MKFEIIELSQSEAEYKNRVADSNFRGYFPNVCCGWMFEFKNKDGKIGYNSVTWFEGTPEEYCETWLRYGSDALFEAERWNGYEPTGRVVFRGYGVEEWWAEERDWCIRDCEPEGEGWLPPYEEPSHDFQPDEEDRWEDWAEALGF